jgi:hypothetical protein
LQSHAVQARVEPCDTPIKLRAAIAYLGRHDKLIEARRARRDKVAREAAKVAKD